MKIQQLTFRTRLILGFGTVLTLSALIIIFAIFSINKISKSANLLYHNHFVVSNSVKDINIYINAIQRTMNDIVLAEHCEQIDSAIQIVNEYDRKIHTAYDIEYERFLGDINIVDEAYYAYENWVLIRNKVIELMRNNRIDEAYNITEGKEAEYVKLLFAKTQAIIDFAENEANEFLISTKKSEVKSTTIIIITSIILFILSFIVSIVISKSISKPLNKFMNNLKQLSDFETNDNNKPIRNEQLMLEKVGVQLNATYKILKYQYEAKTIAEEELREYKNNLEDIVEIRTLELGERVKELNCLYNISKLVEKRNLDLNKILQGVVEIIPPSWQYPEICCARIIFNEQEFITQNFQDTNWKQTSKIILQGKQVGKLEVCYLEEKLEIGEEYFLDEEKALINAITEHLGRIIERKQRETALSESKERLVFFMESATVGFVIYNADLKLISINDKALEIFPSETVKHDLIGRGILEINPELKGTENYNKYLEVVRTGKSISFNELGSLPKFGNKYVSMSAFKVGLGLGFVFEDITERKLIEEKIDLQSKIMLNIPEGIYLIGTADGIIKYTNQKFENMFGYDLNEMIGKHVSIVNASTNKTNKENAEEILDTLNKIGEWHGEIENIKKDGTHFWCYANVSKFNHPEYGNVYIAVHTDITKRKHAEIALNESEERLRSFIDSATDGFALFNSELTLIDINKMAMGILKTNRENIFGKNIIEIVPELNNTDTYNKFLKIIKTGRQVIYNDIVINQFKDKHWYIKAFKVNDGIGIIISDITERKEAEQELQESEIKYRAITNQTTEGITVADMDGNYISINPTFCKMSGYTEKELLKMTVFDMKAKNQNHISFFKSKNKVEGITMRVYLQRKDGSEYLTEIIGNVIEFNNQEFVLGTVRDITEKVKAEQELKESEEKLKTIINSIPDLLFYKDLKGVYQGCNAKFQVFAGRKQKEIVGYTDYDLFKKKIATFFRQKDKDIFKSGIAKRNEEWVTYPDGHKELLDTFKSPYYNSNGKIIGLLGISRDITEIENTKRALKNAKIDAENANQAKSDFLSKMTHELRTPLNSILGYNQIIKKADNITNKQKAYIDIILSSGHHLLDLINDILDISKIEAGKQDFNLVNFSLQELINSILDTTKINAEEKGLYFNYNTINQIPEIVSGDYRKVKQVLLNILSNAVKYTKNGGINFSVATKKGSENIIIFKIEDTGIGILKDNLKVIFEPFNQVGVTYNTGTGLGLAITKNFVDLMKGKLSISSILGKGSCFTVELPLEIIISNINKEHGKTTIQLLEKKLQAEIKIPSIDLLNKIISNAEKGDYKKLKQIINELRKKDNAFAIFCDNLNNMVKEYDESSIIEYINILKNK